MHPPGIPAAISHLPRPRNSLPVLAAHFPAPYLLLPLRRNHRPVLVEAALPAVVVEAAEAAGKTTFNLPQSERALHWLPDRHLCDRYHSLHKGSQTYSSYSGGDDESIKSVLGVLLLFLLASAS